MTLFHRLLTHSLTHSLTRGGGGGGGATPINLKFNYALFVVLSLPPSLPPSVLCLCLYLPIALTQLSPSFSLSNPRPAGRPCLFPYTCTTSLFSFSLSSIGMIIFASTSLHSRRLHKFRGGGRENDSRVIIMVALRSRSLAVAE